MAAGAASTTITNSTTIGNAGTPIILQDATLTVGNSIFTFATNVTFSSAVVTSGVGTVVSSASSSPDGSGSTTVTVNLTGVENAQRLTVALLGVNNGFKMGDVGIRLGLVLGDTAGKGSVNAPDVSQTKSQVGQTVTNSNLQTDVTANGAISASDVSQFKAQVGTNLPPTPVGADVESNGSRSRQTDTAEVSREISAVHPLSAFLAAFANRRRRFSSGARFP